MKGRVQDIPLLNEGHLQMSDRLACDGDIGPARLLDGTFQVESRTGEHVVSKHTCQLS